MSHLDIRWWELLGMHLRNLNMLVWNREKKMPNMLGQEEKFFFDIKPYSSDFVHKRP